MTQPFRAGHEYRPSIWPSLCFSFRDDHIAASDAGTTFRSAGSAFYNGGLSSAGLFVNRLVPHTYRYDDPAAEMSGFLTGLGYPAATTVGLMTAAKLTHASIAEEEGDRFRLVVCTTAGTRNAAKAGLARTVFPAYRPGTINTVIFFDCRMTDAAMLGMLITATEAKASALADLDIRDEEARERLATGTTTDAVVVAVSQQTVHRAVHKYAGCASEIGNAVGRLVYATVREAAATQHEP